ncbi:hypothetical protein [Burkholderia sp. AU32262]|uniref:hypothetical protein n=1 Tax=Burkholderia sp. AU32262 TaxID=2879630 RepID=UPI001CF2EA04|nr:hypothetical protein [Burkholderia sp. AU32262]MCA8241390.1 hypothetical protein [Burkholderia sp. AU32262]
MRDITPKPCLQARRPASRRQHVISEIERAVCAPSRIAGKNPIRSLNEIKKFRFEWIRE